MQDKNSNKEKLFKKKLHDQNFIFISEIILYIFKTNNYKNVLIVTAVHSLYESNNSMINRRALEITL